jgi:nicotinate phosphoribosyltransferase
LLKKGEYTSKRVLNKIFENGNCVFKIQTVDDAKGHLKSELSSMWEESKRLVNPHETYVDLSKKLWDLKQNLLMKKQ